MRKETNIWGTILHSNDANQRHRLDGPAVEYANGDKYWYYEDQYIECESQEEFEQLIKLRAFW